MNRPCSRSNMDQHHDDWTYYYFPNSQRPRPLQGQRGPIEGKPAGCSTKKPPDRAVFFDNEISIVISV